MSIAWWHICINTRLDRTVALLSVVSWSVCCFIPLPASLSGSVVWWRWWWRRREVVVAISEVGRWRWRWVSHAVIVWIVAGIAFVRRITAERWRWRRAVIIIVEITGRQRWWWQWWAWARPSAQVSPVRCHLQSGSRFSRHVSAVVARSPLGGLQCHFCRFGSLALVRICISGCGCIISFSRWLDSRAVFLSRMIITVSFRLCCLIAGRAGSRRWIRPGLGWLWQSVAGSLVRTATTTATTTVAAALLIWSSRMLGGRGATTDMIRFSMFCGGGMGVCSWRGCAGAGRRRTRCYSGALGYLPYTFTSGRIVVIRPPVVCRVPDPGPFWFRVCSLNLLSLHCRQALVLFVHGGMVLFVVIVWFIAPVCLHYSFFVILHVERNDRLFCWYRLFRIAEHNLVSIDQQLAAGIRRVLGGSGYIFFTLVCSWAAGLSMSVVFITWISRLPPWIRASMPVFCARLMIWTIHRNQKKGGEGGECLKEESYKRKKENMLNSATSRKGGGRGSSSIKIRWYDLVRCNPLFSHFPTAAALPWSEICSLNDCHLSM